MITLGELLKIMDFEGTTLEVYVPIGQYACRRIHSRNLSDYYNRKVNKVYFEGVNVDRYRVNWREFYVNILIEGPWVEGTI